MNDEFQQQPQHDPMGEQYGEMGMQGQYATQGSGGREIVGQTGRGSGGQEMSGQPMGGGQMTGSQQMGGQDQQMAGRGRRMSGQHQQTSGQGQQMGGNQQRGGQSRQMSGQSHARSFDDHLTDELRIALEDFNEVTHVASWCAKECAAEGPQLRTCVRICQDLAEIAELNEKLIARDSMFGPEVADLFVRTASEGLPELRHHQQRHPHVAETVATIERTMNSCRTVLEMVGQGGDQRMAGQRMSGGQMGSGQMGGGQQTGGQNRRMSGQGQRMGGGQQMSGQSQQMGGEQMGGRSTGGQQMGGRSAGNSQQY